jgi:tRNA(fMet)-specific endonuclease VapC
MPLYLLDTDHMSILRRGGVNALRLESRLNTAPEDEVVTCIVVYEEQMRGWMAEIAQMQSGTQFVIPYNSLATTLAIYCGMTTMLFDVRAASYFDDLKRQRIGIGMQDLKIAAIALANDATLLTRNARDFARVPGLKFEDWSI